jgi:DNA-directed RNA polymerase specialized sigma24 family protein
LIQFLADDDRDVRSRGKEIFATHYWQPIYAYVRLKWRREPDDAADLVQGFFLSALVRDDFASFDPTRARFRTFLRTCVDRHVMNDDRRAAGQRRGGGTVDVPFDQDSLEKRLADGSSWASPEDVFDREWIHGLMQRSLGALRQQCTDRGRELDFRLFEAFDLAPSPTHRPSYRDLATAEGIPMSTVTNRLAAARREFQRFVLQEIRDATASAAEYRETVRSVLGERRT